MFLFKIVCHVKISRSVNHAEQQHSIKKKNNWICKSHRRKLQTTQSQEKKESKHRKYMSHSVEYSDEDKLNQKQTNECTNYAPTGIKLPKTFLSISQLVSADFALQRL